MNIKELPDGYSEIKHIDLQKDKKLAIKVNVGALLIYVPLLIIGIKFVPISITFHNNMDNIKVVLFKMLLMIVLLFAYIVLHEAVHGIFMKYYGKIKPKFGLTKLYAYAASDAYFNKKEYTNISFSPVVILGAILLIITILVPKEWFWVFYYIFVSNIACSTGDLYVAHIIRKMPKDSLFLDAGVSMTMYSKI
jgi:hypothetical protein